MSVASQVEIIELRAELQRLQYENTGLRKILYGQTEVTFGKHLGRTYSFVLRNDPSYCEWISAQKDACGALKHFQIWLARNRNVPALTRDEIKAVFT